jgi:TetR/AcrR family transcriptional repressor of mexJK operon
MANGYAGVSMDDVQSGVGGSKATLYRYFTDKTDLFKSAVEMMIDQRSEPLRSFHPSDTDDVAETLKDFGRHFAAIVLDPGAIALHRLVTSEAERVTGLGQTFFEHGPTAGNAIMGSYLRTLCEMGVIDVADPILSASQLFQAMLGGLQMRMLMKADGRPTPEEIDSSISTAVDTFLNGAFPRTSEPTTATAGRV